MILNCSLNKKFPLVDHISEKRYKQQKLCYLKGNAVNFLSIIAVEAGQTLSAEEWVQSRLSLLSIFIIWAILAIFIAKRIGFFSLSTIKPLPSPPAFKHVLGAFLIYFGISLLLVPLIFTFFVKKSPGISPVIHPLFMGWFYLATILATAIGLLIYLFTIKREVTAAIFWPYRTDNRPAEKSARTAFFAGMGTWLIAYPAAGVFGQTSALLVYYYTGFTETKQSVVENLKLLAPYPWIYYSSLLLVILIIPTIEEILFRGFLQSWLKQHLGRWAAIIITAVVFAFFHYAGPQGKGNFEIIASLFVLALFLGYLYERFETLWASIGLHVTFNTVGVFVLILST